MDKKAKVFPMYTVQFVHSKLKYASRFVVAAHCIITLHTASSHCIITLHTALSHSTLPHHTTHCIIITTLHHHTPCCIITLQGVCLVVANSSLQWTKLPSPGCSEGCRLLHPGFYCNPVTAMQFTAIFTATHPSLPGHG